MAKKQPKNGQKRSRRGYKQETQSCSKESTKLTDSLEKAIEDLFNSKKASSLNKGNIIYKKSLSKQEISEINEEHKDKLSFLNELAIILTGLDKCAAVFYDNQKKELLIASNDRASYAKEHWNDLKESIKKPFVLLYKLYDKHLNNAINRSVPFVENIQDIQTSEDHNEFIKTNISSINDLLKYFKSNSPANQDENDKLHSKLYKIKRLHSAFKIFSHKVLTLGSDISKNIIKLIILDKKQFLNRKIHAEMQILDKIYNESSEKVLGISKLTCFFCNEVFKLFNQECDKQESIGKFIYSGTHGTAYEKWKIPDYLRNNENIRQQFKQIIQKYSDHNHDNDKIAPENITIPDINEKDLSITDLRILNEINSIEDLRSKIKEMETLINSRDSHEKKLKEIKKLQQGQQRILLENEKKAKIKKERTDQMEKLQKFKDCNKALSYMSKIKYSMVNKIKNNSDDDEKLKIIGLVRIFKNEYKEDLNPEYPIETKNCKQKLSCYQEKIISLTSQISQATENSSMINLYTTIEENWSKYEKFTQDLLGEQETLEVISQ
ncbi:MAG: hypothetical protein DGJ47_000836 [Rickettsiaceae bacterium]